MNTRSSCVLPLWPATLLGTSPACLVSLMSRIMTTFVSCYRLHFYLLKGKEFLKPRSSKISNSDLFRHWMLLDSCWWFWMKGLTTYIILKWRKIAVLAKEWRNSFHFQHRSIPRWPRPLTRNTSRFHLIAGLSFPFCKGGCGQELEGPFPYASPVPSAHSASTWTAQPTATWSPGFWALHIWRSACFMSPCHTRLANCAISSGCCRKTRKRLYLLKWFCKGAYYISHPCPV